MDGIVLLRASSARIRNDCYEHWRSYNEGGTTYDYDTTFRSGDDAGNHRCVNRLSVVLPALRKIKPDNAQDKTNLIDIIVLRNDTVTIDPDCGDLLGSLARRKGQALR
ncbi:MAG: hypothetical protein KatS3mg109_0773 [Pirellulaceae bacterium]|nr:MAG: hypothetical protein KatS3mg109_0773 [Pirellulaceae bacterium]